MVPFLDETQRTIAMCALDWSLIGIKQILYVIRQYSEKCIDIHCKVTFGFKYTAIGVLTVCVKSIEINVV